MMQLLGDVQPAALLPMWSVSFPAQPEPHPPTGLPFIWQLTNQVFAQAPLVPVLMVAQYPLAPVNVVAAQFWVQPLSKSSAHTTFWPCVGETSRAVAIRMDRCTGPRKRAALNRDGRSVQDSVGSGGSHHSARDRERIIR